MTRKLSDDKSTMYIIIIVLKSTRYLYQDYHFILDSRFTRQYELYGNRTRSGL